LLQKLNYSSYPTVFFLNDEEAIGWLEGTSAGISNSFCSISVHQVQ